MRLTKQDHDLYTKILPKQKFFGPKVFGWMVEDVDIPTSIAFIADVICNPPPNLRINAVTLPREQIRDIR